MSTTIGKKEVELLYEVGESFYNKKLSLKEATEILHSNGIKRSSAVDYIYNYSNLINGKVFTRRINLLYTEYFLEKILETKGEKYLQKALQSLSLHIDYYESVSKTNVKRQKEILEEYLKNYSPNIDDYYEEKSDEKLFEGAVKTIKLNIYERNPFARKKCIEFHGCKCSICTFDFEKIYGKIGKNFIHVHHLLEISQIKKEYEIDYKKDLIPVCPNCHAMLHKKKPAFTIEELKEIIQN